MFGTNKKYFLVALAVTGWLSFIIVTFTHADEQPAVAAVPCTSGDCNGEIQKSVQPQAGAPAELYNEGQKISEHIDEAFNQEEDDSSDASDPENDLDTDAAPAPKKTKPESKRAATPASSLPTMPVMQPLPPLPGEGGPFIILDGFL